MNMRPVIIAIALATLGCTERVLLPSCSAKAPGAMATVNGVRYHVHLQDALRCSRETGRPVLLSFQGWASMSTSAAWDVLTDPDVRALIDDRLILCVLLVDDRKALVHEDTIGFPPMSHSRISTTIGQRNTQLEFEYFQSRTQPLFALVDADFVSLAEPMGYVPKKEPELLVNWIEATLERHP